MSRQDTDSYSPPGTSLAQPPTRPRLTLDTKVGQEGIPSYPFEEKTTESMPGSQLRQPSGCAASGRSCGTSDFRKDTVPQSLNYAPPSYLAPEMTTASPLDLHPSDASEADFDLPRSMSASSRQAVSLLSPPGPEKLHFFEETSPPPSRRQSTSISDGAPRPTAIYKPYRDPGFQGDASTTADAYVKAAWISPTQDQNHQSEDGKRGSVDDKW